jgi:hypothetical protein
MSWLCDTTELVPSGWLSSRYAGHGVLAEDIPSAGLDGPSALYGAVSLPADNGKEIRGYLTRWPAAPLDIDEDGTFTYSGGPDYFEFALYADGAANASDIGFGPGISRIWLGMEPGGAFSGSVGLDGVTLSGSFAGFVDTPALTNAQMQQLFVWVNELALIHGLIDGSPLVVTPASRTAGALSQTINSSGETVTVNRT